MYLFAIKVLDEWDRFYSCLLQGHQTCEHPYSVSWILKAHNSHSPSEGNGFILLHCLPDVSSYPLYMCVQMYVFMLDLYICLFLYCICIVYKKRLMYWSIFMYVCLCLISSWSTLFNQICITQRQSHSLLDRLTEQEMVLNGKWETVCPSVIVSVSLLSFIFILHPTPGILPWWVMGQ